MNKSAIVLGVFIFLYLYSNKPSKDFSLSKIATDSQAIKPCCRLSFSAENQQGNLDYFAPKYHVSSSSSSACAKHKPLIGNTSLIIPDFPLDSIGELPLEANQELGALIKMGQNLSRTTIEAIQEEPTLFVADNFPVKSIVTR